MNAKNSNRVATNRKRTGLMSLSLLLAITLFSPIAEGAIVVRQRLADGVFACIRDGQFIFLECRPGADPQAMLSPYLYDDAQWARYKGLQSVAIPTQQLNGATQRSMIEALFPEDYADEKGWWHTVGFTGDQGEQTWHAVAGWFTGHNRNVATLIHLPENKGVGPRLQRGQQIFIPVHMLLSDFRTPSPNRPAPKPQPAPKVAAVVEANPVEMKQEATLPAVPNPKSLRTSPPVRTKTPAATPAIPVATLVDELEGYEQADEIMPTPKNSPAPEEMQFPLGVEQENADNLAAVAAGLTYGQDAEGAYASYKLQRGEAIYTSVVVRFTDFQLSEDINNACRRVLERSGITDPRRIDAGQAIRIPMEILSDRYWPEGSTERREFEAMTTEAARLQQARVQSKDLDGVVVVIDPGHGGADQGASHPSSGLYEDELNYDIACRLKILLETQTQAKVHFTMHDPKQGFEPRDVTRFASDKNEELLTTPRYWNAEAKTSANLRWYLANDIYDRGVRKGLDPRKVVFISIHCDDLHEKMRGTMIYVPGAKYRRDREQPSGVVYAKYEETNGHAAVTTTGPDRVRDEALSRNFAQTIINTLNAHNPKIAVNKHGDPIRNVIRQGGGTAYVPAVLRNNLIPTKVLLETANLNNAQDRERLADPEWRQWYANALHQALLTHFRN